MNFEPVRKCLNDLINRGVPGLEFIVYKNHEMLFHECLGNSDYEGKKPASPSDRYWLYSCTKPVTATAAMIAMDEGLFGLHDSVGDYLPKWKNAYTISDGARVKQNAEIYHLMTMTAGLNYNLDRECVKNALARTNGNATTIEIADSLAEEPLDFAPGTRFQYSLCHDVLGAVIEAASGMTLAEYMKSKIFSPLGMENTFFHTNGIPESLAAQYRWDGAARKLVRNSLENQFLFSPNYYSGGAGLCSTASDYAILADTLACGGTGANGINIISSNSIDRMRTEELSEYFGDGSFTCTVGSDYSYGLGVRTRTHFNEGKHSGRGEFGWDGAAGANFMVDPEHNLSAVYVQHVLGWPDMLGIIPLQLRDALYSVPNII